MNIIDKDLQRKRAIKTKLLSIRITPSMSRWMKANNLSPTAIFHKALEELGFKNERIKYS